MSLLATLNDELDRLEEAMHVESDAQKRKRLEKDWEATVAKLVAYEGEPDGVLTP